MFDFRATLVDLVRLEDKRKVETMKVVEVDLNDFKIDDLSFSR